MPPIPMDAEAVLDRYFLEMRSKVLDLGAALDRIERADGAERVRQDERMKQLQDGIGILVDGGGDRATRIHMIFADEYEPDWPRPPKDRQ